MAELFDKQNIRGLGDACICQSSDVGSFRNFPLDFPPVMI